MFQVVGVSVPLKLLNVPGLGMSVPSKLKQVSAIDISVPSQIRNVSGVGISPSKMMNASSFLYFCSSGRPAGSWRQHRFSNADRMPE